MSDHNKNKETLHKIADELEADGDGVMFVIYSATDTDVDDNTLALRVIPDALAEDIEKATKAVMLLALIAKDLLPIAETENMVMSLQKDVSEGEAK
jgi:hypothetical protein